MVQERLCVGVIVGAQGVRGEVRVKSFTEDPVAFADYGPLFDKSGRKSFHARSIRMHKGIVIARIDGVNDRNAAEALKGVELFIDREALPDLGEEEVFYHADLIGLEAVLEDGSTLGRVEAVHDFGAGDILDIRLNSGGNRMIAFTKENAPEVDLEAGRILIVPPAEVEAKGEDGETSGEEVSQ